ncbi:hypothetical protein [Streptomyces sp. ALI-76-A]|uniref:hypothetical protein n=1 Tax=Streptomyces sp. ALI-76-A TaxID=3025736 RepID=UPI00256EDBD9|nr:hypothetical protein [Streptomyces sp. ALI-76-A]MDL5202695.1 hypothetical protein [Streptomyces sp. ALI-76-A]
MTPWARATVLLIVAGAGGVVSPYGGASAYGVVSASASGSASGVVPTGSGSSASGRGTVHRVESSPAVSAEAEGVAAAGAEESASGSPPGSVAPHGPMRASASASPSTSPSASASVAPSPSAAPPSRAGSRAGEGRERPGRRVPVESEPAPEEENVLNVDEDADGGVDGDLDGRADGAVTAVPRAPRETALMPSAPPRGVRRAAEPRLPILPLGSGLILVGLGLGLAFVALRVRRGAP